jgi:uncharacterized protein (DUF2267 family)
MEAAMLPMPQTFEQTALKSRAWVDEMGRALAIADPDRANHALRAGLHAIRDWLPQAEAIALGAQLPMLIRGLYYENWQPTKHHGRDRDAILAAVRHELGHDTLVAGVVFQAVIRVLINHVSSGEIDHIIRVLPQPIVQLWLDAMA